ncbi:hypothetical protein U9M48_038000 [Paspalum notatum var. saurae]|uniref:Reverse transcriptase Ty1/copia-type domain-containing protein n=1 Tax=Paspalum notatum var. saurae TaxID=547442 RepID=A0AAQ3XD08_PASNO
MQGDPPLAILRRMTLSQRGSLKPPFVRMNLSTTRNVIALVPLNYRSALADPTWRASMAEEYQALITMPGAWFLGCLAPMWSLASGSSNTSSILMVHLPATRLIGWSATRRRLRRDFQPNGQAGHVSRLLSIAVSRDWPIHQLDVKNTFLHGHMEEIVYCEQPPGFVDLAALNHVYVLRTLDTSLFVYKEGGTTALLLYIDDIILTASSPALLQLVRALLHSKFAMTDLGTLRHFLGISVT